MKAMPRARKGQGGQEAPGIAKEEPGKSEPPAHQRRRFDERYSSILFLYFAQSSKPIK
jgi:hypothetical protein